MNRTHLLSLLTGLLMAGASGLQAADHQYADSNAPKADPKPYPLGSCVVSGEKFDAGMGEPVVFEYAGREVKLCCESCRKDFDAAPAKFVAKIDAAAKLVKPYPLKTCLVSGEELGAMGKPLVFVEDRQEVKLCCKSCKKDFDKNSKQYLSQLKKPDTQTKAHEHQP